MIELHILEYLVSWSIEKITSTTRYVPWPKIAWGSAHKAPINQHNRAEDSVNREKTAVVQVKVPGWNFELLTQYYHSTCTWY